MKARSYDAVSPITSPNESILLRYFRPSDLDFSPSPTSNRSISNYHKRSTTKSSGGSSKSPLTAVKNLEDDVLVMDGILVDSNKASKSSSGKFRSSSSTLCDSSSNSGSNFFKTELCMTWEITGSCRYGHKCQFAHGKEELRPNSNRARPQKRLGIIDPYYSPQSSTSSGSSKYSPEAMVAPNHHLTSPNWSPLDDGIVKLPQMMIFSSTPRKAVDVYIDKVLYGCAEKKRFPAFVDVCPN